MKIKKEYIILLLIIIALSVYLFTRSTDRTHYQLPALARLEPGNITKIEISIKTDTMVLKKKDNQWYLEPKGYLADANKVNAMLSVFETLSLAALVSESKDYQRYDLDPAKRINAKAWQEDALMRDLDIGRAAPSFRHTFIKLSDDSRVFHANENFRAKFEQTLDNLRDHGVLSFKVDDIQEVHITKDQSTAEMVRKEVPVEPAAAQSEQSDTPQPIAVKFEWQDRNGKKVNAQNLNRFLTALSNLNCARYIDDRQKDSFSEPIYSVKLTGSQEHQLKIFAMLEKDADNYPAVSSGSDYAFLLSNVQVQQIMKEPSEMLATPEGAESKPEAPKSE